jgi:hypothetical protein
LAAHETPTCLLFGSFCTDELPFLPLIAQKKGQQVLTYAQKLCCGATSGQRFLKLRYKTSSACKLLIHMDFLSLLFLWAI